MNEKEIVERKYPNNDLRSSIVYPIYLVSKEIIRKYNEYLSEYDLTYTQYLVMMYFFHEKKSNLKRIGKAMMLDSSTLTPLLKKLEKKGYIIREKSLTDERNLLVSITEKGEELKPKLKRVQTKIKKMGNMTEEEINQLHEMLYKLLRTIIEENKNDNNKRK